MRTDDNRRLRESDRRFSKRDSGRDRKERFFDNLPKEDAEDSRIIEGRNAVLEAMRSGRTIDRLLIQSGCQDGRYRRSSVRQRSAVRLSIMYKESGWTRFRRRVIIRG